MVTLPFYSYSMPSGTSFLVTQASSNGSVKAVVEVAERIYCEVIVLQFL